MGWIEVALGGGLGASVSIVTIFMLIRRMMKPIQNQIYEGIKASIQGLQDQPDSVNSKVVNNSFKALIKDITSPESPIGAVMEFFPQYRAYIEQYPTAIIGIAKILPALSNLWNVLKSSGITSPRALNSGIEIIRNR